MINRHLPQAFFDLLAQYGELRIDGACEGDVLAGAVIVVASAMDPIDRKLIDTFPQSVGLIANIGVGTDNIDLEAAAARGIAVSNTPVVTADTADLAMALILACCRRLPQAERALRAGQWGVAQQQLGARVHGRTLGIVGMGAIGQAVARRAAGFAMPLLYWGRQRRAEAEAATGALWCESLEDLVSRADIVSLHCPLSSATHHLINADVLARFKPGSVLVNTSRGAVVDEAALVQALKTGPLAAAGLDVFEFEPAVTPELLALDGVVLLPHIGSATAQCRSDMALRVAANIKQFMASGVPLDRVV